MNLYMTTGSEELQLAHELPDQKKELLALFKKEINGNSIFCRPIMRGKKLLLSTYFGELGITADSRLTL